MDDFRAASTRSPPPSRTRSRARARDRELFDLTEHDVQRNRLLVAEQGRLARRSTSPREEQARQAVRAADARPRVRVGELPRRARCATGCPGADPRLLIRAVVGLYNSIWQWYRPERHHRARACRRVLHRAHPGHDRPRRRRLRVGPPRRMSFFERYFAALDGPEPTSSLALVADDVEFVIYWAADADRKSAPAARRRGRAARDDRGRRHGRLGAPRPVCRRVDGDVEFALGETRWDDGGERIGTFLAAPSWTPTAACAATWSRARPRSRSRRVRPRSPLSLSPGRRTGRGCSARRAGAAAPSPSRARARARAARRSTSHERPLARAGHAVDLDDPVLPPKSPPYAGPEELRALRRRLRRAAGRGARRGAADRVRPRAAADRDADGADPDPGARRRADVRVPRRWRR